MAAQARQTGGDGTRGSAAAAIAAVAALAAAVLSGYLAFVALALDAPPAGCGAGSSCGDVLASSWSRVFGVPVALPAALLYLGLFVAALRGGDARARRLGAVAAGAAIGAFAWFTLLQAAILRAFCGYCFAIHSFGLVAAALLLVRAGRGGRLLPFAVGFGLAALLAGAQIVQPRPPTELAESTAGDYDRSVGGRREIGVQDGQVRLVVGEEPRLGSETAPTVVVLLMDYACPHCRRVHQFTQALIARGVDLLAVALPAALDASCNPHIVRTARGFEESCALTRLSLAVHFAAPERWAAFDAWLFEPATPRTAAAARAKAEDLLGAPPDAALADPRVEAVLQRNIAAFGRLPARSPGDRRLPVVWSPGRPPIVGAVESGAAYIAWLNRPVGDGGPSGDAQTPEP